MKIVRMNDENIYSVLLIEKECFKSPWSFESFNAELSKVGACFYLAQNAQNKEPMGYIGFNMILDEGYIANLAVRKGFRRQGVGKALLNKVMETAGENKLSFVTLEVRESNASAINLYKSFGFSKQGVRKNFYRNPQEDGLILTKFLK